MFQPIVLEFEVINEIAKWHLLEIAMKLITCKVKNLLNRCFTTTLESIPHTDRKSWPCECMYVCIKQYLLLIFGFTFICDPSSQHIPPIPCNLSFLVIIAEYSQRIAPLVGLSIFSEILQQETQIRHNAEGIQ